MLNPEEIHLVNTILNFWFCEESEPLWFCSTPEFDQKIRSQFLSLYERAASGGYDSWSETPLGVVALCVLLDQFPRNMFRGNARAFATDAQVLAIARSALGRGFDGALGDALPSTSRLSAWTSAMATFLVMPFEHSENPADQAVAVRKFTEQGGDEQLRFGLLHRDVILRFGRFPGRNRALGRVSTPDELAWLDSPEGTLF